MQRILKNYFRGSADYTAHFKKLFAKDFWVQLTDFGRIGSVYPALKQTAGECWIRRWCTFLRLMEWCWHRRVLPRYMASFYLWLTDSTRELKLYAFNWSFQASSSPRDVSDVMCGSADLHCGEELFVSLRILKNYFQKSAFFWLWIYAVPSKRCSDDVPFVVSWDHHQN